MAFSTKQGTSIHIGTSGWNYDGWVGKFYPEKVKSSELLPEYANTFDTVEVNNSFYHLPAEHTVAEWSKHSPRGFIFSCKASRYITHMKKLKDPQEGIQRLLEAVKPFGRKLGPILFQLPPRWKLNLERLQEFVEVLPAKHQYAFEFRDKSWLCDPVYDLLEKHNMALCVYDYKGFRSPEKVTADFVYIRLHGPSSKAYAGSYDSRTLASYARKIRKWQKEGKDVYCYFDNDQKAYAPADACELRNKLNTVH